jgi:hypothetical protein
VQVYCSALSLQELAALLVNCKLSVHNHNCGQAKLDDLPNADITPQLWMRTEKDVKRATIRLDIGAQE